MTARLNPSANAQHALVAGARASRPALKRYTRPNFWEGPAGSEEFIVNAAIAYPTVGAGETQYLSYTVPQGYTGRCRWLWITHIGGTPPDGTGNVIWRVRQNGTCLNGFSNLIFQLGSSNGASFGTPFDVASIELEQGDVLTVTVQTIVAQIGGVKTAAQFHGWVVSAAHGGLQ